MTCAAATAISYFPWFAFHLKEFVKCIQFGHAILICCEVFLNLLAILGWSSNAQKKYANRYSSFGIEPTKPFLFPSNVHIFHCKR